MPLLVQQIGSEATFGLSDGCSLVPAVSAFGVERDHR
jgi:hypothetical protein